jgi:hypothetical protein
MNLGLGGGVRIGQAGGLRLGSSLKQPPATIAQTAYGAENSPTDKYSGGLQSWHLAVAVPVLAVGWLAFLRWSLPK